ncbi:MAG: hypothetical protein AB7E49_11565 [Campylobacterales bacterium]
MKRTLSLLITLPLWAIEGDLRISNTNFLFGGDGETYDYNRLRFEGRADAGESLSLRGTIDNEHLIGSGYLQSSAYQAARNAELPLPFDPYRYTIEEENQANRLYLYRLYGRYESRAVSVNAGLIRVPFGVGRVWTPTDLFNPLNIHSLETDERLGVAGVHAVVHTGDFSRLELVGTARQDWQRDKIGAMLKGPWLGSQTGISLIDADGFKMAGLESEWHLGETGALGRFEGGWFFDHADQEDYFKGMLGFDHGFVNGLTLAFEALYDQSGKDLERDRYLGATLSYPADALLTLSGAFVANLQDGSLFASLATAYSLGDNTNLGAGANLFEGTANSEYGSHDALLFLRLSHYF